LSGDENKARAAGCDGSVPKPLPRHRDHLFGRRGIPTWDGEKDEAAN
jgi:hypothetical protein